MGNPTCVPDTSPLEVLPGDISAYRAGNVGIDYVHRLDSGQPGPHVLVNALTHGNEICGVAAVRYLLDQGIRPLAGTLTVSFANVAAYEAFDIAQPYQNRQLAHNLNRIWSPEWLDGTLHSPELARARELAPVVAAADYILDIHSTRAPVVPFWVYPEFDRNADLATKVGAPLVHLTMPVGTAPGTALTSYGQHGRHDGRGSALVVECGQHFSQTASDLAVDVTLRFLSRLGVIQVRASEPMQAAEFAVAQARRFRLLDAKIVKTDSFRFARPFIGFETLDEGELIATDGDEEIRSPCDGCTIFMPTQAPIVGREAVYLTLGL